MQLGLDTDAFEGTRVFRIGPDPREGGMQCCAAMAELLCQMVSVRRTAELCPGSPAAGKNNGISGQVFRPACQKKAGTGTPDPLHGERAAQLDTGAFESKTQDIQNTVGRIGERVDAPAVFGDGQKAETGKKAVNLHRRKGLESRCGKRGVGAEICSGKGVPVREVAAAVAGGKQLAADALLPFQQEHAAPGNLRSCQSGCDSGSTAADDSDNWKGNGHEENLL